MRFPKPTPVRALWGAPLLALGLILLSTPLALGAITLNEIRIDQPSTDNDEFFELAGNPGESLNDVWYLVIGDGTGVSGVIEAAINLTGNAINGSGLFFACESTHRDVLSADLVTSLNFENSDNVTHFLVTGFTGLVGDDLDPDDDCVLDIMPWTSELDRVALIEEENPPAATECHYGPPTVGPDGTFVPGHVYKCPGGWFIGLFDIDDPGANDTPGAANVCAVGPVVDNVYHRPILPSNGETVTVTATATDQDGTVVSADLLWRLAGGGSFTTVAMVNTLGDVWEGSIPGQSNGTTVEYYVEATDNDANTGTAPSDAPTTVFSYTVGPEVITPIADIHANLGTLTGTIVQVQGQVYCPGDYRNDGNVSAYIQDGSGRGINVFAFPSDPSTGGGDLNSTGNIVKVTGTVELYFTTVELVDFEVELVSTGNPPLTPAVQASTADAASPDNEGTYIQSTGVVTDITGTGAPVSAYNVTINDCSGPVVVRVDTDVVDITTIPINLGDRITASGAGGNFAGDGQILVCSAAEISVTTPGVGDLCPPVLLTATLTAASEVTLGWDEAIDPVTGGNTANYSVFETANPGNTVGVLAANVAGTDVVLSLAAALMTGTSYTVCAENVEDTNGNASGQQCLVVFDPNAPEPIRINEIMQNPSALSDTDGEWFEIYNEGQADVDINGWTILDLGTESHVITSASPLLVPAGGYAVLARNATAMAGEGVTVLYQYAGITLGNADDEIILRNGLGQEVDRVEYDGGILWPDPTGSSMQFDETQVDNNDGANWVGNAGPVFGSGDRGTPGAENDIVTPAPPLATLRTALEENHPNPFNPNTVFRFTLERRERTNLSVYNVRGQLVRTVVDEVLAAGVHTEFSWDGRDERGRAVTSGTYFYRLTTESGFDQSGKMALLK